MLNPELNLHTHKFTCRVHGESPGELCNMLSTLQSLETHIFQSPDELLKAHHPHHVFLHRLELVVAPEYKDHVALEVRGANLFKFLFAHVVFLVISPPIFQFPSYESVAFPWYFPPTLKTLFKRIFPTYSAQLQFSCTCSSPHFPFLGKLLQPDFSGFLYWFFFWLSCKIYLLSLMNKSKSIITCTAAKACPSTCLSCKDQYASLLLHA